MFLHNPYDLIVSCQDRTGFQSEDGSSRIEVRLEEGTVWLPQNLIAELYQITKKNVSLYIRNLIQEEELDQAATVRQSLRVQNEGSRAGKRSRDHYNPDMILGSLQRLGAIRPPAHLTPPFRLPNSAISCYPPPA